MRLRPWCLSPEQSEPCIQRTSPFSLLFADKRIDLLSRIESEQKSVQVLEEETAIPKKTIYRYLKSLLRLGAVKRTKKDRAYIYSLNKIIWPELKDFVTLLQEYQVLRLVPRDALLIRSYENSVLFKSPRPQDATFSSFSAYKDYGIELFLRDYYYTLPKRELSIGEIFIHSLDSAEDYRQRLFCVLFYLKNRDELKDARHPMMKSIRAVLRGEHIKGYPTVVEIEEHAELYGINDIEP
ncbi:MAG: helix-turn-helix domain-containing protein [Methanothrix sp.]